MRRKWIAYHIPWYVRYTKYKKCACARFSIKDMNIPERLLCISWEFYFWFRPSDMVLVNLIITMIVKPILFSWIFSGPLWWSAKANICSFCLKRNRVEIRLEFVVGISENRSEKKKRFRSGGCFCWIIIITLDAWNRCYYYFEWAFELNKFQK